MFGNNCRARAVFGLGLLGAIFVSSPVCRNADEPQQPRAASAKTLAEGPEQQSTREEKSLGTLVDQVTARKLAQVFAFQKGRIRQPVRATANRETDGNWTVVFMDDCLETADGHAMGYFIQWSQIVTVSRNGRCSVFGGGPGTEKVGAPEDAAERRLSECAKTGEGCVNEASAALLAKSFALRRGLIPTDTISEEQQLKDGAWLVSFVPGTYLYPPPEGKPPPVLKPCVVHVDVDRKCKFFFKSDEDAGNMGSARAGPEPVQNVDQPLVRAEEGSADKGLDA
jgi:hypothetical protein